MQKRSFKIVLSPIALLILAVQLMSVAEFSLAEEPSGKRLFSTSAVSSANAQRKGRTGRAENDLHSSRSDTLADALIDERGMDDFHDLLTNSRQANFYLAQYRGMAYLQYFDDLTSIDALDDVSMRSTTEKLVILQSADTIADLLIRSPMAEIYRRAQRYFRTYQEYTTVRMDEGNKMQVKVGRHDKSENTFLRFRIHTSMREGIQPRLDIGENIRLKHDPLDGETVLEYSIDF